MTINDKVTKETLNRQPVVLVTESNGSSFTIAASGKPYPLKAVTVATKNDPEAVTLTFSDYGKRVVIQAPADAIDLASLLEQNPDALLPPATPPSALPTEPPNS